MNKNPIKVCAVIPFFNNHKTVAQVINEVRKYIPDVIAVDDGSTDGSLENAKAVNPILIQHTVNSGKGAAIKTAARYAIEHQFTHMIQIDADHQHDPAQIPLFLRAIQKYPEAVLAGYRYFDLSVPFLSRFGRWFGNLWFKIETLGAPIYDTQCGFRAYPITLFQQINSKCNRMDFDVEILIQAIKNAYIILNLEVDVRYFKGQERVTHFHPFLDNWRMSRLHFLETWKLLADWPKLVRSRKIYKQMNESDIILRKS